MREREVICGHLLLDNTNIKCADSSHMQIEGRTMAESRPSVLVNGVSAIVEKESVTTEIAQLSKCLQMTANPFNINANRSTCDFELYAMFLFVYTLDGTRVWIL